MRILFRPFQPSPEEVYVNPIYRFLKHPFWALLGLRPVFAQHTRLEHKTLRKWAKGRRCLVEIGVAKGASALALRQGMHPEGTLYLIDPFHLSRFPGINAMKKVARMTVGRVKRGNVVWIEKFSFEAVKDWKGAIDLLFIDGDHSEDGVKRDWEDWSKFVVRGGVVIFHDARVFPNGWTRSDDGPVKLVDNLFRKKQISGWKIVDEVHSIVVIQRL